VSADTNKAAIQVIADQFDPPRPVVATERVNEKPVVNGFTTSYWDEQKRIGMTAIASGNGTLRVFLEFGGSVEFAEKVGDVFAKAIREF
jgi:hypothetical protein